MAQPQTQRGNYPHQDDRSEQHQRPRTDLVRVDESALALAHQETLQRHRSIDQLCTTVQKLSAVCNIVAPIGTAPALPPGHQAMLSVVTIDPRISDEGGETYEQGKAQGGKPQKYSLHKSALDKIAA